MAERVDGALEPRRRRWYPWAEWTDGSVWRAKEGEDFSCSPASFQTALHLRARQQGLSVSTGSPEQGIVEFQFTQKAQDPSMVEAQVTAEGYEEPEAESA